MSRILILRVQFLWLVLQNKEKESRETYLRKQVSIPVLSFLILTICYFLMY